jgi:hypothetical protein
MSCVIITPLSPHRQLPPSQLVKQVFFSYQTFSDLDSVRNDAGCCDCSACTGSLYDERAGRVARGVEGNYVVGT